jgi:hypothetical protein
VFLGNPYQRSPIPPQFAKDSAPAADPTQVINPISSAHANDAPEVSKPHIPKVEPQVQTPKSGALSHDQVRLKSAGEVDHDAGRK